MNRFSEVFEDIFTKYSYSATFHVPFSVKELKLFTEGVCLETYKQLIRPQTDTSEWSSSDNKLDTHKEPETKSLKTTNVPIGLSTLNQTFNILQLVGKGKYS